MGAPRWHRLGTTGGLRWGTLRWRQMGEGIRGPVSEMEGNPALFWGDLWERGGTGQATGMGTGGLWGREGWRGRGGWRGCLHPHPQPWALPDAALGVPEHGGSEALRHSHQAGAIHLHDEVVHLDPEDKGTVTARPSPAHPHTPPSRPASSSITTKAPQQEPGWGSGVGTPYLPSRWAAPPSVTVLTKMPSFSKPMSAPAPMPMMLIPNPAASVGHRDPCPNGTAAERPAPMGSPQAPSPRCQVSPGARGRGETHLSPAPQGTGRASPPSSPAHTLLMRPWGQRLHCGGRSPHWSKC